MRQTFKISGLLAALLLAWGQADAAGLGRLTVQSALGQPLKAEIELYSVAKDELPSINAKLANVDAFRQARIERLDALNNLRFSVDSRPNGQPIIRVSSSTPINDPFLDLLIELNWASGRLLREYTLLLDPPVEAKPAQAERPAPPAPPVTAAPVVSKPAEAVKPAKEEAKPAKPEKPVVKEYGPVKRGETLRSIAGKLKPEGASTEQMMVGLYQANQDAFLGGNMNRLKKGEVLKVPEFESLMLAASPSQARQMIQEQAAEWHAARAQAPAKEAAVEPAKDKAVAAGKIEPAKPAAQPAAAAPAKDVLKLSKGEPVTAGKPDAKTTERLHALEEDLAAKSRALKEAQDRVAQLEKTVKDLQRLVELKTQQPVAVPVPETKPAAPAEPVAQAEAPKPAAPPAPKPETKPEPGLLDSLLANPLYLGGGLAGVLLLVLLGISVMRRRRQQQPGGLAGLNTGLFGAGAGVTAAASAVPTAARPESSVLTDFSRLGLGAIDTQEIDPIAEAEVYLAYGKDAQAEEIMRDALNKNPGREDILLKLLEIYHGRKDIATFETTARDLQSALGSDTTAASWIKAAGMGREIDPANPLYELPAAAAGMAAPESPASILDMEMPTMEAAPESIAEEPAASVLPPGLDFEFTMETPSAAEPEAEAGPAPAEPSPVDAAHSLDFSAELMPTTPEAIELPEAEPTAEPVAEMPVESLAAEPAEEAVVREAEEMALPDLDFGGLDLELKEPESPAAEAAPAAVAEAPDFLEALGPEAAAAEAASVESGLPDLDFGSLDLNVNEAEASASAAEAPTEIPAMENEELWAEVNTKLDLARAYIEMGDKEGAREILQEVLAEGNSQQAAEANKLLSEAV
ncbi:MAG: hypothetical protein HXY26_02215 [Hydrogenophilaceae bacterium]|nr:hypothetical protein [Hydrogenophilaceae bacterium]